MKRLITIILIISTLLVVYTALAQPRRLRIASTTSTDNTGLFNVLNPPFEEMFNCRVDIIAQGTGKAIKTGEMGDCDVVFVHSRPAEDKFVADGYGINRRDVMYNDFIIIGPRDDPAGIRNLNNAGVAFKKIAQSTSNFISRGDDSGTHKKERDIWKMTDVVPGGKWYIESGQGMGAVLVMANELNGYTLSDRGTYLAFKGKISLDILSEGDPVLFNPYGIIAVNPAKHPEVNYVLAMAYIGWVTSLQGQKIIKEFGRDTYGQPLFIPVAIP